MLVLSNCAHGLFAMSLKGFWTYPPAVKALLLAVPFAAVGHAHAATYASNLADASWQVKASIFECSLSHPIAAYGSAIFTRRAGEPEVFRLYQQTPVLPAGTAQLQAILPSWNSNQVPIPMGQVAVAAHKGEAVRLDETRARQLQEALDEGRRLVFLHSFGESAGQSPVRVVLQPIHFHESIQAYRECIARLLPVNFDQIARTAVYFPETAEVLPATELRKLDTLIRYVKADTRVNKIYIDGHTDSVGVRPENLEVSKTRAEMIAAYLIERGIPEDNLVTRWHGERYPVASNKTAQARAQNRRVTLRLERGNS